MAPNSRWQLLILCAALVAGCGSGGSSAVGSSDRAPASAQSVTVVVQPAIVDVEAGDAVSFSAEVFGAADTRVAWSVAPDGGVIDADGRYTAPAAEGDYEVVATSRADGSARGTATARVRRGGLPAQAPTISSFSASPSSIEAGQATTFTWSVAGATSLAIEPGVGPVQGTSATVSPTTTTTYTLTATGDGTATAQVTVTVSAGCLRSSLDEKLQILATKRILFTHASVGAQMLEQLQVLDVNGRLSALEYSDPDDPTVTFDSPSLKHVWYGNLNNYGDEKIQAFERHARQAGATADIVQMKLCYADLDDYDSQSYWDARFAEYQADVDALRALYPGMRVVHWTVPVVQASYDSYNAMREYFSDKIRATYAAGDIFDLADVQSRDASGEDQCLSSGTRCQHPAWDSDDHAHMNDAGNRHAAEKWVDVMACPNG